MRVVRVRVCNEDQQGGRTTIKLLFLMGTLVVVGTTFAISSLWLCFEVTMMPRFPVSLPVMCLKLPSFVAA